jgi:hypothetical protein
MTIPVSVQSALDKVRPEHIAEMSYVDCRDTHSTDMVRGQNALFVVLKPGIGYDLVRGSFVAAEPAVAGAATVADSEAVLPAYRFRLLGAFDGVTGEALRDVDVVDVLHGTSAKTTASGVVSLFFLPEGTSTVELRRNGYRTLRLDVSISPRDTTPLTLLLNPPSR